MPLKPDEVLARAVAAGEINTLMMSSLLTALSAGGVLPRPVLHVAIDSVEQHRRAFAAQCGVRFEDMPDADMILQFREMVDATETAPGKAAPAGPKLTVVDGGKSGA